GVPGIGPKTAAKLLQEFGSLDNILANLDKVPGKKQESLRAAAKAVELSRQLVRLDTNVPLPLEWDAWRLREPDVPRLLELFREWGFRTMAEQVRAAARLTPAAVAPEVAEPEA